MVHINHRYADMITKETISANDLERITIKNKLKGKQKKIYELIARNPGLTKSELCQLSNIDEQEFKNASDALKAKSLVYSEGSGNKNQKYFTKNPQ